MQRVLFHSTIFGPIHSRRLGVSLGVNLSPRNGKVCSFDCLYCEAGFNAQGPGEAGLPMREEVRRLLDEKLREMKAAGSNLDVITFSGNGEPTLHPDFAAIVDDTLALRNRYFPDAKVSVLTNSTRIDRTEVVAALKKVDNNILKLDSAVDGTIHLVDRPNMPGYSAEKVVAQLKEFRGSGIIQTMILRGEWEGVRIDNSTDAEIAALIEAYREIGPREVMIYSLDRPTPARTLEKVGEDELRRIAERITAETGIPVKVN
ncbi:MAG: radical SAM protein [Muribaculaceae bacterium]|nr:radical SAM protein [Muribaculaceae bacterium]